MNPNRLAKFEFAVRLVLEFNEAFNRHDIPGMMKLMSADCLFENTAPAPDGKVFTGKDEITRFWQKFFQESPQAHIHIEEIFGMGYRCTMRWRYDWVDANGNQGHVRGVDLFRVQGNLICEKLSYVKG